MGSPIPVPPPLSGQTLPASDLASTNSAISTQEVDTQYLQGLLGMKHGVSTGLDSEMLGTMFVQRIVLHECMFPQIWKRRHKNHHPAAIPGIQSCRKTQANWIVIVGYRCVHDDFGRRTG